MLGSSIHYLVLSQVAPTETRYKVVRLMSRKLYVLTTFSHKLQRQQCLSCLLPDFVVIIVGVVHT